MKEPIKIHPEILKQMKGGPKTEEGKIIASKNALKHGILSNVLTEYDKVNVAILMEAFTEEFSAHTYHQKMLVEQLVLCYVKLARCTRMENDIITESLNTKIDPFKGLEDGLIVDDEARALVNDQTFKRLELMLLRYEPQLLKRMVSLIETLKKYQDVK